MTRPSLSVKSARRLFDLLPEKTGLSREIDLFLTDLRREVDEACTDISRGDRPRTTILLEITK